MQLRHGRTPTQQRARDRVERVLEGAARAFTELGYAGATTNRIAAHAGVHVPSVYQYFPNKDAILAELWDRHVDLLIHHLRDLLAEPERSTVRDTTRIYISTMLQLHAAEPALLGVLYQEGPGMPGVRSLRDEAVALLVPYLRHHQAQLRDVPLEAAAFVLASAVEGVARQAVVAPAPSVETLTTEVTRLVTSYLGVADV